MFHQFNGNNISKIHLVSKLQGILKILPNPILLFAQVFVFLSNKNLCADCKSVHFNSYPVIPC